MGGSDNNGWLIIVRGHACINMSASTAQAAITKNSADSLKKIGWRRDAPVFNTIVQIPFGVIPFGVGGARVILPARQDALHGRQ